MKRRDYSTLCLRTETIWRKSNLIGIIFKEDHPIEYNVNAKIGKSRFAFSRKLNL